MRENHASSRNISLIARVVILWCIIVLCTMNGIGQSRYVIMDSIIIQGNKHTKNHIIFNEIDFHPGDTISLEKLPSRLQQNERRLRSISLFNLVTLNIKNWNTETSHCNLVVAVQENWFIYPYLIFELADRNFNVWRKEFNYALSRTNYGIALNHINLTGHKDKLKLKVQGGYIRKLEMLYDYPYLWGKWGLTGNILYSESREVAYQTLENKPVFYKNAQNERIFRQYRGSLALQQRINPQTIQSISLEYNDLKVDNEIVRLNPNFLGRGESQLRYFILDYSLKYDNTVYPLYPLKGYRAEFNLRKEGFGWPDKITNTWLAMNIEQHFALAKNLILSAKIKFKINIESNKIPYMLNDAIGYKDDNITGYQLYVIDGRHFMLVRHALKYRLLEHNFKISDKMPKPFRVMNTQLFARLNLDAGYANDPSGGTNNPYTNRIQLGYGPGLDLILFNNFTASMEIGITRHGEAGIFFSGGLNF